MFFNNMFGEIAMITRINNEDEIKNKLNQFPVEFYAYNCSTQGLTRKVYFYPTQQNQNSSITLSPEQIDLVSQVLDNETLVSYRSDIYTLCDFSLRNDGNVENVGFSFKIIDDSSYTNPLCVFEQFTNFDVKKFSDVIVRIQKALFYDEPEFNPVSMIGLLFGRTCLKSIKSYVRFDYSKVRTFSARVGLLKRVITTINPGSTVQNDFLDCAKVIERLGFQFVFVGIDCDAYGDNRFKLYFRTYDKFEPTITAKETRRILDKFNLYSNVDEMFSKSKNGMWGFAISTADFTKVEGIQLYFYP